MIKLPRVLKNLNLIVDGRGYAGRVDELTLPKLTFKTEDHRAGGMDAPVELEMGMERLEASFVLSDYDEDLIRLFGRFDVQMTARGAIQRQGEDAVAVVVQMRGGQREIDPGNWKPGDKAVQTFSLALAYYKLTIGGQEMIEIDVANMVRKVGGTDQLATQRTALGL